MTPSKQDLALARDIMDRIERDGAVHLDSLAAVIMAHRAVREAPEVKKVEIKEAVQWPAAIPVDAQKRLLRDNKMSQAEIDGVRKWIREREEVAQRAFYADIYARYTR